jgi:DNA-binding beta-propeller fold protein YncE
VRAEGSLGDVARSLREHASPYAPNASSSSTGHRHLRHASAAAMCLAVVGLAHASAPAWALRAHAFAGSFGGEGAGNGQLALAAGVAVSRASGEVYVIDSANNRVERFSATGKYISQFDGKGEAPVRLRFFKAEEGPNVADSGIAIDNSSGGADPSRGDVYVADTGHNVIDKFTAAGAYVGRITKTPSGPLAGLFGVAVDSSGVLWDYQESGQIDSFGDAVGNPFLSSRTAHAVQRHPGFAVDAEGSLYANINGNGEEGPISGLTILAKLNAGGEALNEAVDREASIAPAVDLASNELYLDNASTVGAFSPDGAMLERFGLGHLSGGAAAHPVEASEIYGGIAVNPESGNVYVADSGTDRIDIFAPEAPSAPTVHELLSKEVTAGSAELAASIDPHGAPTSYYFQYGPSSCTASPSPCSDVPAAPGAPVGADFEAHNVAAHLEGLAAGTYYYRVLAVNEHGPTEGAQRTFTVPPGEPALPDGRSWELVSPPSKNGAVVALGVGYREGEALQASADGTAMTYGATAAIGAEPQGNRSLEWSQIFSARSPTGWSSQDIAPKNEAATGFTAGNVSVYKQFSTDLSLGLVEQSPGDEPPLSPEATEKTIYLHEQNGVYKPLVTTANVLPGKEFGPGLQFLGATPDLSHVVFRSPVALIANAGEVPEHLYEWAGGRLQLVSVLADGTPAAGEVQLGDATGEIRNVRNAISSDGSRIFFSTTGEGEQRRLYMRDVASGKSVRLDVAQGPGVPEPERAEARFQTAAADGSRVFFTDTQRLTADSTASPEGENQRADLYECEVIDEGGKPACSLHDLTVAQPGENADVQGELMGASEDGTYVYVVATGVLAPGASPGADNLYELHDTGAGWTSRLVAILSSEDERDWDGIRLDNQRNGELEEALQHLTARVSPHGRWLTFMSDRSLTGYDNVDLVSGKADEEVFLYDALSNRLVCASCNPSGARPTGVFDPAGVQRPRLLIDSDEDWQGRWLAASIPGWTPADNQHALTQSRYLSDSGRLFFDSAEALVPPDVNGRADVYQYEPLGIGGCTAALETFSEASGGCVALISSGTSGEESAFLDASASGGDAFFLTASRLAPQDYDTALDIYDAHECTGASPCLGGLPVTRPPCATGEACKGAPSTQPARSAPSGSATFSGPGNLHPGTSKPRPPTRAKLLARALRACKKKPRRRRAACEALARRRYGAKATLKTHGAGTRLSRGRRHGL